MQSPENRVIAALQKVADAEAQLEAARQEASAAVDAARDAGVSWDRLSEATEVPERRLKWLRIQGNPELLARERERQEQVAQKRPALPPESGLSVSEAAAELGISRALLYRRIQGKEAGELEGGWSFRQSERGKTRVYRPGE